MTHQLLLTTDNIRTYLAGLADLPFDVSTLQSINVVEAGKVNHTFVITAADGARYFLQQAQPKARVSVIAADEQPLPVERMEVEASMLQRLATLWGTDVVPPLHHTDPVNQVIITGDAAIGREPLDVALAAGRLYSESGATFGQLLGQLHVTTRGATSTDADHGGLDGYARNWFFNDHLSAGIRRRVDQSAVGAFYADVAASPWSIVWGDPIARNIFIAPGGNVGCIDFNYAVPYDSALDIGLLLAHWVWMGLKPDGEQLLAESLEFQRQFWTAYEAEYQQTGLADELPAVQARALRWLGIYLVSRVDGNTGSRFSETPEWEAAVRSTGIACFNSQPSPAVVDSFHHQA